MYESMAAYYEHIFPAEPKAAFLSRHFSKNDKILDAGCADGKVAALLAKEGFQVFAIDLSEEMIRTAQAKREKESDFWLSKGNMLHLEHDFEPNFLDGLYCIGNTFMHLTQEEKKRALAGFYRHLKKGGTLLMQTLNYAYILDRGIDTLPLIENEWLRFERKYEFQKEGILFHTALFLKKEGVQKKGQTMLYPETPVALKQMLLEAGFEIKASYGNFSGKHFSPGDMSFIVKAKKKEA